MFAISGDLGTIRTGMGRFVTQCRDKRKVKKQCWRGQQHSGISMNTDSFFSGHIQENSC